MSDPVTYSEVFWSAADGTEIAARQWTGPRPHGVMLIVHGIGDHGGRFEHVARHMATCGFDVLIPDMRGHGRSSGQRGYIRSLETLVDDLELSLQQTSRIAPGHPLFVYGQSFGGLLSMYYAMQRKPVIAGVTATSPPLRIAMRQPGWKVGLGNTLGKLLPRMSVNSGIDIEKLSDDPQVAGRLRADRYHHRRITPAAYNGMIEAGQWCLEFPNHLPLPMLVMHGDADVITDHLASQQFAHRHPAMCELKIWQDGMHELHNMTNNREILDTIVNFQNTCIREVHRNTG
ncbi:MAG: lysophospholipase [Pirellulaceae bacterium]